MESTMPRFYIIANYGDAPSEPVTSLFGGVVYFDTIEEAEENAKILTQHGRHNPPPRYDVAKATEEPSEAPETPLGGLTGSQAAAYRDKLGIVPVAISDDLADEFAWPVDPVNLDEPGVRVPGTVSVVVARQMLDALRAAIKDADWRLEEGDAYPPWLEAVHAAIAAAEKEGL
jgi:hypothetical protein